MDVNKLDKARRELRDFAKLINEIWTEDLTDEQELLYLKFYKAGVKVNNDEIAELEIQNGAYKKVLTDNGWEV